MRKGFFKYLLIILLILTSGYAFSQVTITVTNVDDPTCGDPTGGRIDVDVSGGVTPYTLNLFESPATFIATKSGNGPTFFFDGLGEGTYFIVVTDNTGLDNDVTPSQILTITQPTISILTPLPIDVCENAGNQNLAALVSADIGGGTFTFSGPGVSGSTFNPSGLGGTTVNIDVDYSIPPSCNAPTVQITYNVNDAPNPALPVSDAVVCNPASGDAVFTITSAEAGVTYELTNGGTPLIPPVTGTGTGANLDLTLLQADLPTSTTTYTVVASIAGCPDTNLTDQPVLTVNPEPDATLGVSDAVICNPATGDVDITITNAENGVLYELTNGGVPLIPPVTGTGTGFDLDLTILLADAPLSTTTYTVVATIPGCSSINLTDQPTITVNDAPDAGLSVSDASVCNPAESNVTITIAGAENGVSYELTNGGVPLIPPVTGTGGGANLDLTILQANAPTSTTTYTVVASIAGCTNVNLTDQPTITVSDQPDNTLAVSNATICSPPTGDIIITIATAETGVNYELTVGGTPLVPPVTGTGAGANLDLTILQANAPVATTTYTVVASRIGCNSVDLLDQPIVTVNNSPDPGLSVSDATSCNPAEGDVVVTISGSETGVLYELTNGGVPLVPPVTGTGTGGNLNLTILQANAPVVTTTFTVEATVVGCPTVNLLDQPTVTVSDAPNNALSVSDATVCNPASGDVIITITSAESGILYELTNGGASLVPPVTGTGTGADLDLTILQANAPTSTITFTIVATQAGCSDVNLLDQPTVTVNNAPDNSLSVADPIICNPAGGDVIITINGAEAGVTYELTNGGASLVPPVTGIGAGGDLDLTILQANAPIADIIYDVEASVGGCPPITLLDQANVAVNDEPNDGLSVSDASICNPAVGDVIITITGAEVGVTYQLTDGGVPLVPPVSGIGTGADLDLNILQANAPTTSISYTVEASIPGCSVVNLIDPADVTVTNTPNSGLTVSDPIICNPATGDVIVTVGLAEAGVTYELTNGGAPLAPPVIGVGTGADLDLTILQANAPTSTTSLTVVATISGCVVNLVDQAVVSVNNAPGSGLLVSDATVCNPAEGDIVLTITGAEPGVSYELTNGGTPLVPPVTGVGTGSDLDLIILQANAPAATTTYTVVASINGCTDVNLLDQPIVTVNDSPDPGLAVSDALICNPPSSDVIITITAAESGVDYELTIGGTPLTPPVTGTGAGVDLDLTILQANAPAATTTYTVVASVTGCSDVSLSDLSTVTVTNEPDAGLTVSDASACNPAAGDVFITITAAETGVDYELTIGGTPLVPPVAGTGAGADLNLVILQADVPVVTTTYDIVASIAGCSDVTLTDQSVLTINDAPTALTFSEAGFPICEGSTTTLDFQVTGGTAPFEVDLSTDGGGTVSETVNIPDNNLFGYVTSVLTTTVTYSIFEVRDANGCILDPGSFPADITVTVLQLPTVIVPADFSVCESDGSFSITGTLGGSATDGNWSSTTANGTISQDKTGLPDVILNYTIDPADAGLTLDFTIDTDDPNGCGAASQTVNVFIAPAAPVDSPAISGPTEGCDNETAIVYTASAITNGFTYQWELDGALQPETSNTITLDFSVLGAGNYTLVARGENGCGVGPDSTPFVFDVLSAPIINTQPADQAVCEGEDAIFTTSASGATPTFQWQVDTGSGFTDIVGETNATLTVSSVSASDDGNNYQVIVRESNSCPVTSTPAILSINANTVINTQPADQTVNVGDDASFMVDASGTNLTYQWQVSTDAGTSFSDLLGETTNTLIVGNAQLSQDGNLYQVIVQGDCGVNPTPNPATLTVVDNTPPDCSGFIVQVSSITNATCNNSDGGFTLNTNGTGTPPFTVVVGIDSGQDIDTLLVQSDTTIVSGLAPGNYRYSIEDALTCSFSQGGITIVENQLVASFDPINSSCSGDPGSVVITVTTGAGNYRYFTDSIPPTPFISGQSIPFPAGNYDNIFVDDSTGDYCPTSSGPLTITEPNAFEVVVEQTLESVPERASGSILLRPISGGQPYNDIGYWASIVLQTPTAPDQYQPQTLVRDSVAGTFNDDQGVYQIDFEDLFAGIYEITVFDSSAFCFTVLNVEVPLDTDLFIPNVFTPNQDGFNDFFFIRNMPEDQPTEVTIVNRWGKKVYSSSNYQNDWRAEDVSDGVYYYTINVGGETVQGWVEVWRGAR